MFKIAVIDMNGMIWVLMIWLPNVRGHCKNELCNGRHEIGDKLEELFGALGEFDEPCICQQERKVRYFDCPPYTYKSKNDRVESLIPVKEDQLTEYIATYLTVCTMYH